MIITKQDLETLNQTGKVEIRNKLGLKEWWETLEVER